MDNELMSYKYYVLYLVFHHIRKDNIFTFITPHTFFTSLATVQQIFFLKMSYLILQFRYEN